MNAVIYCRVSTKEQAHNLSLPTQLRACQDYCERHNIGVAATFEDAGESAKTIDRPQFQELLRYCREHKTRVQFVVVFNLTRFSRNAYDHAVVRALLQRLAITLRSVNEPITDDPVGRLTENMLAAIGQFDNDQKAERTKAGMMAALDRGQWTWRAPLGYVSGNKRAGDPSLVPDPERAHLIRRAFELAAMPNAVIVKVLESVTALGLRSQNGRPVTAQTFSVILRNSKYAGRIDAPRFGIRGQRGDFEPLITEALFERVQQALRRGAVRSVKLDHPDFPLRRFVVCDPCGTPLTGSASKGRTKRYRYYHCRRCNGVSIPKERLETDFAALLRTLRPRAEFLALFKAITLDVWRSRLSMTERLQVDLRGRLEQLQSRQAMLEEAYVFDRRIDADTYDRQRDRLREEMALAQIALEDARIEEIDVEGLLGFAEHILNNAERLWLEAPTEQKRALQNALFPGGVRLNDGRLGTAVTCLAFSELGPIHSEETGLASPAGFEPAF